MVTISSSQYYQEAEVDQRLVIVMVAIIIVDICYFKLASYELAGPVGRSTPDIESCTLFQFFVGLYPLYVYFGS